MLHLKLVIVSIIALLPLWSCTEENTDTSVTTTVNPVQVSINVDTIPPALDTLMMFDKMALDCFFHLGHSTGGEFYYKSGVESVHQTLVDIVKDHGQVGADIIFLVDKTSSMFNDIDSVRANVDNMIEQLKQLNGIQLGAAAYGDKNVDGPLWYEQSGISIDYDVTSNFVKQIKLTGGGDYPESVYDGIAEVINNTDWRENSKKMILVVGDAPSLEDSLTGYNRRELLELCNSKQIKVNLFPVLVSQFNPEQLVEYAQQLPEIIEKIYPNPASDYIELELKSDEPCMVTILDVNGLVIVSEASNAKNIRLNIPEGTPDGTYILRVMPEGDYLFDAEKIVITGNNKK